MQGVRGWLRRGSVAFLVAGAVTVTMTGLASASVSTDGYYYNAGDTVQITGDQMAPGESVTVDVAYPDGSLAQEHVVLADDAGNFADSYTLPLDAPAGVYAVVATGQTSGSVFTTTFDPGATFETQFSGVGLDASSITYGQSVTLSGYLQSKNAQGNGNFGDAPNGLSVGVAEYHSSDCTGAVVASTTATTVTDPNNSNVTGYFAASFVPNTATTSTWSFKASFAGATPTPGQTFLAAADSGCQTVTVNKAPTDTSITNTPATSFGLGGTLSVDYLLESKYGISGNYTGGTVSVAEVTSLGTLGCGSGDSLNVAQNDADGGASLAADAGFGTTGTLTCTPTAVGSYTYKVHYSGDNNYLSSNSANQSLDVTLSVQVCKAAPAVAVDYMKSKHVKAYSTMWNNVITDVAHQTGSQGQFFAQNACDPGYVTAVNSYIHNTYGI